MNLREFIGGTLGLAIVALALWATLVIFWAR